MGLPSFEPKSLNRLKNHGLSPGVVHFESTVSGSAMPDKQTVFSADGQWKADFTAFKNYAFFYASIGCDVAVYTIGTSIGGGGGSIWGGSSSPNWVSQAASIHIQNVYQGNSQLTGLGSFTQDQDTVAADAELKLWAVGLLSISINTDSGDVSAAPGGASLNVESVTSTITVVTSTGQLLQGVVSASSAVSDNSIWG